LKTTSSHIHHRVLHAVVAADEVDPAAAMAAADVAAVVDAAIVVVVEAVAVAADETSLTHSTELRLVAHLIRPNRRHGRGFIGRRPKQELPGSSDPGLQTIQLLARRATQFCMSLCRPPGFFVLATWFRGLTTPANPVSASGLDYVH